MQEALEVLRTTPNNVKLIVCRPRDERYRKLSPPTEPPKPPQRTMLHNQYHQHVLNSSTLPSDPLSPIQTNFTGVSSLVLAVILPRVTLFLVIKFNVIF